MTIRFDNQDLLDLFDRNPDLKVEGLDNHTRVKSEPGRSRLPLPKESERDFQGWVIKLLQANGWKVAHFRPGMTGRWYVDKAGKKKQVWVTPLQGDAAGWPDIFAIHSTGRLLVLELKSQTGKLSPEQEDWMRFFGLARIEWHVIRPQDREKLIKLVEGFGAGGFPDSSGMPLKSA